MSVLHVNHKTTYVYKKPVEFGEHRLMSRPRDSHDLRLLATTLVIDPPASAIRWIHDVFGNSIAIATFNQPAEQLVIESGFRAEHFPTRAQALEVGGGKLGRVVGVLVSHETKLGINAPRRENLRRLDEFHHALVPQ